MCMWFWNFDSAVFDGVIVHADLSFANHNHVSAAPSISFIGFIWSYVDFLPMIWRCACGLGFLNYFGQSYCPCWHTLYMSETLSPQLRLHLSSASIEIVRTSFLWYEDVHVVFEFWFDYFYIWLLIHFQENFLSANSVVPDQTSESVTSDLWYIITHSREMKTLHFFNVKYMGYGQGSYASGKCQGNLKVFKVRELSGNFIICQGKLNFC